MPKDRRSRSVSFDRRSPYSSRTSKRRRQSPFPSLSAGCCGGSSSSSSRNPPRSPAPAAKELKEWEDARCPVCMEHPHNAVLLLCASHDKGCRPFMCDTSYRHSNCLDQYRKSTNPSEAAASDGDSSKPKLSCPLCRGFVSGWEVLEAARKHMNTKARTCSTEACGFSGAYGELRKHARTEHPFVRPSDADPERQRDWRRLEQQRDLGDLFSTMQSAIGGGDEGFAFLSDGEFGGFLPLPSITLFLVLSFRGPGALGGSTSGRSSVRRGSSRSSRSRRARARVLWGESIVEAEAAGSVQSDAEDAGDDDYNDDDDDDDDDNDDGGEEAAGSSRQHRRRSRRLLRMPDDDDDDDGNDESVV